MKRAHLLRVVTLGLAFVHTFPARRHLALFFGEPSWSEAWKGFGALLAIAIYLFPPRYQASALHALWNRRRVALTCAGFTLTIAHVVPALDHIPKFLAEPSWGDAWRGFGAALAAVWFLAPLPWQASLLARLCLLLRWRLLDPATNSELNREATAA